MIYQHKVIKTGTAVYLKLTQLKQVMLLFTCVQFGIEDLKKEPDQTACWDGVRNYQVIQFILMCFIEVSLLTIFVQQNCTEC